MNNKLREIIVEIEGTRRELNDTVADLAQVQLDFRSLPQSWSVGEVLDHLRLIESSVASLITMSTERAQEKGLGPDLTGGSVITSLNHFRIEKPLRKVRSPPAVTPQSRIAKAGLLEGLSSSRAKLLEAVAAAAPYNLHELRHPHPSLGELDLYQWILFIGKHERRHIAQITGVRSAFGFPPGDIVIDAFLPC